MSDDAIPAGMKDARARVAKYIADYKDAPNWGGPTMYPAPPSLADLRLLTATPAAIVTGSDERAREVEDERNLEAQRQAIEACARIADHHAEPTDTPSDFNSAYELAAKRIARAIRRLSPNAALAASRPTEAGDHGLGPHATVIEDGEDGFKPLAIVFGHNAYIVQDGAQITISREQAGCLAAALATQKPPADDEARRLIERLASADIDVSGTPAIGINSADIIAASDWLARNLTGDGARA